MTSELEDQISHIELSSTTTMKSAPRSPSPTHESDATMLSTPDFEKPAYEEPLYTEINIPLPRLPSPPQSMPTTTSPSTKSTTHTRARSLSTFSPFRLRSSSSPSRKSEDSPRVRPSILKNREVAAAMDLTHQSKRNRSSTIDALAVVPAVLVLSAELFTPGTGEAKNGRGKWEDGIR